jgi:hypothetical protein
VDGDVRKWFGSGYDLPVKDDPLARGVGFLAEGGDLAVYLHPALADEILTRAPGAYASTGHHLLQTFFHKRES